jgi:hypothetical protein
MWRNVTAGYMPGVNILNSMLPRKHAQVSSSGIIGPNGCGQVDAA